MPDLDPLLGSGWSSAVKACNTATRLPGSRLIFYSGEGSFVVRRSNSHTWPIAGVGATAILTMIFALISARLVIRWCPRGVNCQEMGQALFGLGLIASFIIAGGIVVVARLIIERWTSGRPS